jgi:hypothetical protein
VEKNSLRKCSGENGRSTKIPGIKYPGRKRKKSGINVQRENGHADVLVKTPKSSTYVGRYQH